MATTVTPLDPPLEVDLSPNPGRVRFETLESVEEWINAESKAWNTFQQKMREAPLPQSIYEAQRLPIVNVTSRINQARQVIAQGQKWMPNFLEQVRTELQMYLPRSKYPFVPRALHSKSPAGRRVLEAAEKDDLAAVGVLAFEIGAKFLVHGDGGKIDSVSAVDGVLLARLQHLGFDKSVESEREAFRQLAADWSELISEERTR